MERRSRACTREWTFVPTSEASLGVPRKSAKRDVAFAKNVIILNALVPGVILAWDAAHQQIGANGVNFALHTTGLLSFIFLLLMLLVTPLRLATGWNPIISFRRTLGLYAFFYACVHFLIFFTFDRAGSLRSTVHEILFRRYLQIGTTGLLLMVPLAVTSTNAMVMRLGAKRWKNLHRASYAWSAWPRPFTTTLLVKSDVRQPLAFAAVLTALLGFRVVRAGLERKKLRAKAALPPTIVLSTPAGHGAPKAKPRFWSGELRVARVFDETPDVRTFRLVPENGGELPFAHEAGQYLNLALTIDGKRIKRSYTIASSPTRSHYCEVTVKRSASGHASHHLHDQVRAGSRLAVSAPAGRFVFSGAGREPGRSHRRWRRHHAAHVDGSLPDGLLLARRHLFRLLRPEPARSYLPGGALVSRTTFLQPSRLLDAHQRGRARLEGGARRHQQGPPDTLRARPHAESRLRVRGPDG